MTDPKPFGTFFLPGPTEVRREILEAMLAPMISHRGAEFAALYERVQSGLRDVFRTSRPVYVATASATGMMEAGMRCAPAGAILALVNGAFSERFAHIAEACGRSVDRYEVEWGETHDAEELARRLSSASYAAVAVVHSETSTGAMNDVRRISDTCHEHGVVCLIDSVSGAGGAELRFDEWELDYLLTGSQKALALPPGLSFAVTSESFMTHARSAPAAATSRGVYFDLVEFDDFASRGQVPNTPAISLFFALDAQLAAISAEGIEQRWTRHRDMAREVTEWLNDMRDRHGIEISALAREGCRAPTVTTIRIPPGMPADAISRAIAERGIVVGEGYGKLKKSTIRIGHMGDHTVETVRNCLAACEAALTRR